MALTGERAHPGALREYCKGALDRAASCGAQTVVLGSGGPRKIPDGYPREKAMDQLRRLCFSIGEICASYGITLAVEPLNRKETNVFLSVAEVSAFCRELNHPRVKVLADLYHMREEAEPLDHIPAAGGLLAHVHFCNPDGRAMPTGQDAYPYQDFGAAVRRAGYDGRVSIEAGVPDSAAQAAEALRVLQSAFSPENFA